VRSPGFDLHVTEVAGVCAAAGGEDGACGLSCAEVGDAENTPSTRAAANRAQSGFVSSRPAAARRNDDVIHAAWSTPAATQAPRRYAPQVLDSEQMTRGAVRVANRRASAIPEGLRYDGLFWKISGRRCGVDARRPAHERCSRGSHRFNRRGHHATRPERATDRSRRSEPAARAGVSALSSSPTCVASSMSSCCASLYSSSPP
jgi:hypothetical protein